MIAGRRDPEGRGDEGYITLQCASSTGVRRRTVSVDSSEW